LIDGVSEVSYRQEHSAFGGYRLAVESIGTGDQRYKVFRAQTCIPCAIWIPRRIAHSDFKVAFGANFDAKARSHAE